MAKNRDKINQWKREWEKKKRKEDPNHNMKHRIRNILYRCVHNKGGKHTFDILGYTSEELIKHIEQQFYGDMDWNNMSEWDIHHIIPLNEFNIIDENGNMNEQQVREANALSNLIPLLKEDHAKVTAEYFSNKKILTKGEINSMIKEKRETEDDNEFIVDPD